MRLRYNFNIGRPDALCALLVALVIGSSSPAGMAETLYKNPVIPGDHPDPSIIRAGRDYWATATSAEWSPPFPLLHSTDLVNWQFTGSVFSNRPAWAVSSFWAPEISEYKGKFYVYYTGRNRSGFLRVGVARADKPGGPYADLGPIDTPDPDSIDPAPFVDEKGNRYLIWKSDGNAHDLPTTIWAQLLDESGAKLIGKPTALIGNDAGWEGPLVEGPFILKHHDWYYLFYSGSPCCGPGCNYAMGVARSHHLLGPWTKNPANPILAGNEHWQCPGHGSIVEDPHGHYWLLYHAYSVADSHSAGRQSVLDEVKFGDDDWPTINKGKGPSFQAVSPLGARQKQDWRGFFEDFKKEDKLQPGWIWPQESVFSRELEKGMLTLKPGAGKAKPPVAILCRPSLTGDYVAVAEVETAGLKSNTSAGLAAAGNDANFFAVTAGGGKLRLWEFHSGAGAVAAETSLPETKKIYLRLTVKHGYHFWFAASADNQHWISLDASPAGKEFLNWEGCVRIGLAAIGNEAEAQFHSLRISPTLADKKN